MTPFRRILLAVDLTPCGRRLTPGSELAAEHAIALASRFEASVVLLHATGADEAWDEAERAYVPVPDGLPESGRAVLDETLDRFLAAGLRADLRIASEHAALAVLRGVVREEADLVVAGKRNVSGAGLARIGSVAKKLLRTCPCAVWVVKSGSAPQPRRILAATDLTAVGERVVATAALVAERCDAALDVLHTFQRPFEVQMRGNSAAFEREQIAQRRRQIEEHLAVTGFSRDATLHIGLDSPSRAILAFCDRFDPDLVVIGTVSRSGVAGFLLGNTAERLLEQLDVSLLTVKPADFVSPVSMGPD